MSVEAPQSERARPDPARRRSADRAIRRLVIALVAIQVVVAVANLTPIADEVTIAEILDVNREATAVAWFTSALLLAIALAAVYAAACNRASGAGRRDWIGWLVVAGGFVILSVDETAQIHERIGDKVSDLVDVSFLPDLYSWVLMVAPIALLGALWMLSWMRSTVGMRSPTARLAVLAVAMWAVVPVLESLDPTLGGPDLLIVIEETLETAGATTFLVGMLLHLRDRRWLCLPETAHRG